MNTKAFEQISLAYNEVPWFRQRWFILITILLITPVTLMICLTGDIYAKRGNVVYRFTDFQRKRIMLIAGVIFSLGLLRLLVL